MNAAIRLIARRSPTPYIYWPFLGFFAFMCVFNGAWQAGLENAVLENQRVIGMVDAVVEVPPSSVSLRILSEIQI